MAEFLLSLVFSSLFLMKKIIIIINRVVYDKETTDGRKQGYSPVAFPGFSWSNLQSDPSKYNSIPRNGGSFSIKPSLFWAFFLNFIFSPIINSLPILILIIILIFIFSILIILGSFYSMQLQSYVKSLKPTMVYIAMFDEVNEVFFLLFPFHLFLFSFFFIFFFFFFFLFFFFFPFFHSPILKKKKKKKKTKKKQKTGNRHF